MGVRVIDGALGFTATIDDAEINRVAARIEARISAVTRNVRQQGEELDNWAKKAAGLAAGYVSFAAANDLVSNIIKVRGEFQQLEIAFTTMLKSKKEADKLMAQAVKLAATTPFGLQDVASGAKQLLAYGTAAKDIVPTLTMLGNIASGVSAPLNDIVYLYGTLQTQGRAYAKDIQQFTGRGIPIIKELASQFKVTEAEVMGLVEAGKIGFPEVQKAFENMTSASGMFYNLMAEQSKSLTGQLSNLEDSFDSMLNAIGQSNEGILNAGIEGLNTLVENYDKILDIIKLLIATYGIYRTALIANTLITSGMTVVELLHYGALVLVEKAQALLNLTMLANPYVAAATALGALVAALIIFSDNLSSAQKFQETLNSVTEETNNQLEIEKNKLTQLIAVAKNENLSKERRLRAISDINKISPEYLGNINLENINTQGTTVAIENYTKALAKSIRLKTLNQKLEENIKASQEGPSTASLILGDFGKLFGGEDYAKTFAKENAEQRKAIQNEIKNALEEEDKSSNADIKPTVKKNKGYFEEIIKTKQKELDDLDKFSKEYKQKAPGLIKDIQQAEANLLSFDASGKAANRSSKELEKWGGKKLDILNKVQEQEASVYAKSKTQSEKEIEDAHNKYEALRKELIDYNRKAPKGQRITAGTFTRIDNLEQSETGDIKYRIDTELFKTNLDRQKELYLQYEEYKKQVGVDKARERFGSEIDLSKTYLQKLQLDLAVTTAQGLAVGFTGPIQERLNSFGKLIQEETKRQADERDRQYADAYAATLTYEQKVANIKKQYNDSAKALGKNITDSQKTELLRQRDAAIAIATDEAYQKTEIYRRLNEQVILLSRQQAKSQINSITNILKSSNNLPEEYIKSLRQKLKDAENVINKGSEAANNDQLRDRAKLLTETLKNQKLTADQAERYRLELQQINSELSTQSKLAKGAQTLSSDLSQMAGALSQLSSSLEGSNDELAYALGTLSQITQVGSDAAGAFASFASGDIIGGITKTISAVAGLFSIGKKVREMNEKARAEVQKFYDDALNGEVEYQALLRERERSSAAAQAKRLTGLQKEYELLKKQSLEINKQFNQVLAQLQAMGEGEITGSEYKHGTWLRKAKTDYSYASLAGKDYDQLEQLYTQNRLSDGAKSLFEQLRKLKEEGADVTQTLADIAEQAREIFTGTTADSLTNALFEMFQSGKTGAQDLADFFKQTMDDAALSIFKNKILAAAMDEFYDSFAEKAQSDEQLNQNEIADLEKLFQSLTTDAASKFEQLKKITGSDLSGSSGGSNTMSGAVKGITAVQADLLAGQFGGLRLSQIESNNYLRALVASNSQMYEIANNNLQLLIKIEVNTGKTAANTDRLLNIENSLSSMDKKMSSNANAGRAGGFI